MTVKELIEALQECDPDLRVLSPKDDEGNEYRWPTCVDDDAYLRPEDADEYRPEQILNKEEVQEWLEDDDDMELSDFVQVVYVG